MLQTIKKAFQIEEIRKKILFTFVMLVVIRFGSQIPTPGVNAEYIQAFFAHETSASVLNLLNAFTGGSFTQMSIFALSISPYITSSIIVQLLTIALPKLEEWQKEGETGKKKMTKLTRIVTVALAVVESAAMAIGFGRQGLLSDGGTVQSIIVTVFTLTAGSAFLMWIGERITERGIGNGISMVLLFNILSTMPGDFVNLYQKFIQNQPIWKIAIAVAVILIVLLFMVVFVVILQEGESRVPVQYAQKVQGRKNVGGRSSHIPLKVNTAGVIPVIFSSSIMQVPVIIATLMGKDSGDGIGAHILRGLSSNNWVNPKQIYYSWGLIIYIILTVFFAYFYTSITFNPLEVANNMKKSGGSIPGIRTGAPTVEHLTKKLNYIIFVGATALIIVQVVPFIFNGIFGAQVSFLGTSLIIIVGVVLETLKQVESQMLVRNYKGFLNT